MRQERHTIHPSIPLARITSVRIEEFGKAARESSTPGEIERVVNLMRGTERTDEYSDRFELQIWRRTYTAFKRGGPDHASDY